MEQRLRYTELVPEGVACMRALEHYLNSASGLEPILLELVRLRASLLNGCEYCIEMHGHELKKHNETDDRIAGVAGWRELADHVYTHREQAALAWTEAVTNVQDGHAPDAVYEDARSHFSEVELCNLTLAITSINSFNRLAIAFRAQRAPKPEPQGDDDGGKVEVEE